MFPPKAASFAQPKRNRDEQFRAAGIAIVTKAMAFSCMGHDGAMLAFPTFTKRASNAGIASVTSQFHNRNFKSSRISILLPQIHRTSPRRNSKERPCISADVLIHCRRTTRCGWERPRLPWALRACSPSWFPRGTGLGSGTSARTRRFYGSERSTLGFLAELVLTKCHSIASARTIPHYT